MIVNQAAIQGIYTGFKIVFNNTYDNTPVLYPQVAMEVPSSASDENYAWLGTMPSMREWIGDRQIRSLTAHSYTIKNRLFENTVSVSRTAVEDDQVGVFKPMIMDLAETAKKLPDKLVFGLLADAFTELCYDEQPFISDSHSCVFKGKKIVQSNKGTDKLSTKSYSAARASMMALTDDDEQPLYIVPDLLVVSPKNEAMARRLVYADEINHETNVFKGTAEVLVVPHLIKNPDMWFLLCTSKSVKPFIFQNRLKPSLVAKDNPHDDNVFMRYEYLYGVDCRCNAGYGLWQLAYGSDGTTEEDTNTVATEEGRE